VLLGRQAAEVTGEWDIGWPFTVEGEIDDDTLLGLVAFVRSKPEVPGVPEGAAPRHVDGMWPISHIRRTGDTYLVSLLTGEATGARVTVGRVGGAWVISDYLMWIV